MKTFLKVIGIIVVIVIGLMISIPLVFHKQIMDAALKEANKQLDAKIQFEDYSLSLFRSFPNFNLGVENLSIENKGDFAGDTLLKIESFEVIVSLMSVFRGNAYDVRKIELIRPDIILMVNKEGMPNWDIASSSGSAETKVQEDDGESDFVLSLKELSVEGGKLVYQDETSGLLTEMKGVDFRLSGDFSADFTSMETSANIREMNLDYEGVRYVDKTHVELNADIDADIKNEIYTLKDNELKLNEMMLRFNGSVSMLKEGYNLTLTFNAPDNSFKSLLSLVPAIYMKDFDKLETSGSLSFNGKVKGVYTEEKLPEFGIDLSVKDAMFMYPGLPQQVNNIQVDAGISNPGEDADQTIIDVRKFHMEMAGNPVDMKLFLKNPVSDPYVDAKLNARINLDNVKEFYPLDEGEEMHGIIESNISFSGKMSSVEQEKYEEFTAFGSMFMKDVSYESSDLAQTVDVRSFQVNFSPAYMDLVKMKVKIGESDFSAEGKIENYLSYALQDGILRGSFTANSSLLDLNALMTEESSQEESEALPDTLEPGVFKVPANIVFDFTADLKQVLFQNYVFNNVNSRIKIENSQLIFEKMEAGLFDGQISMTGSYYTPEDARPGIDMDMSVQGLKMQEAVASFGFMKHYAPILERTTGNLSISMNINTLLQRDYMPVYSSMNGDGTLKTENVSVKNSETLIELADKMNVDLFRELQMKEADLSFEIREGELHVKPFDVTMGNVNAEIEGYTSLDRSIDYTMDLDIPQGKFGKQAGEQLNKLLGDAGLGEMDIGDMIGMAVKITGTVSNPQLSFGLSDGSKAPAEQIRGKVKEVLEEKKEEVINQAKEEGKKILEDAGKKAEAIMDEARKQAEVIKSEGRKAAERIRQEADKQASQLVVEGKKNGLLAEAAAKETAKNIRREADEKAAQLVKEADKKAEELLRKAQAESDQLRNEAKEKVDNL
ncbi:MAG: AsmA-like C-terminal region-containing protein [Bacteroidota bacterium]|nr:AsmA-like C-terminal region-containing protein [Bacteroidota bacterium]